MNDEGNNLQKYVGVIYEVIEKELGDTSHNLEFAVDSLESFQFIESLGEHLGIYISDNDATRLLGGDKPRKINPTGPSISVTDTVEYLMGRTDVKLG